MSSNRSRRAWSLRARLLVTLLLVVAGLCTTIGVGTEVALHAYLMNQNDERLEKASERIGFQSTNPYRGRGHGGRVDLIDAAGLGPGTLVATVDSGVVNGDILPSSRPGPPDKLAAQTYPVLLDLPVDGDPRNREVPGLGRYRLLATTLPDGRVVITGLPTGELYDTLWKVGYVVVGMSLLVLLAVGLGGSALIRVTLKPLNRVAATAGRVAELPLHAGDVALAERVPEIYTDPRTEVGQVGAALNRMLGHVASAFAARQASETRLRKFIADASHELRTPLAAIRGYAELGRREGVDSGPVLLKVETQAKRMTALVEDLLLLARLDAGRPLELGPVDLSALVVESVGDAHVAGPDHRWRLDLPGEPVVVVGDAARLHQVVANLLANARTHTPPGTEITVKIATRTAGEAELDVTDNGPGIPTELQPHIFQRFTRGDGARSRTAGSTGLGLSIVDAVVQAHRGGVRVESRPGHTTFTVTLPRFTAAAHDRDSRRRHRGGMSERIIGPAADPPWARPALLALLAATAALYLWGLSASGWANAYYAAAAQAGSESWKAWFFGSFDASNAITVDKTPASLWVMSLSARIFGVSSWSLLVPEALMGVATVGVLYAAVKRWSGPAAGLIAGAVLAATPVATLMFRFNNPDALLVLLLVGAAYATVRAVERASVRWLMFAGALVGFGFLTKMLQAFLVVPALALVYLVAAPTGVTRRILHLLAAGGAMIVAGGWWVAIVELWPASSRPYIGGSQTNSVLELTLGYNGLGRITGEQTGSVGGGNGWGETGWTRLFDAEIGGQIAWLLPAALILLVAGLMVTARRTRTDRVRVSLLLWGGWLVVTGVVFSQMQGIFHAYYTVALAPAVGALVGVGAVVFFGHWHNLVPAGALMVTVAWAYVLLGRSASFQPWLRPAVVVVGVFAAVALVLLDVLKGYGHSASRLRAHFPWVVRVVAVLAIATALAAPLAYSVQTAASAHTGSIPTAGPVVQGGGPGGGFRGGPAGGGRPNFGGPANGGAGAANDGRGAVPPGGMADGATRGGLGGLLNAGTPSAELVALLRADADSYTWVAAAVGANSTAGVQLGTGLPVMAIGGFNGSDPAPTLEQFQQYVAEGRIHYFIGGSGMRANGGSDASRSIAAWVAENHEARTVGGVTLYDLSAS